VVGLKPTYGRVSRRGVSPLSWTLDHVGPLTRTVEDAALVLQAIAGPDPNDPSTLGQDTPDFVAGLRTSLAGIRIGVPSDEFHSEMAPDVRAQFRAALEVLDGIGLELEDVEFPRASEARTAAATVLFAEAASVHERWLPDRAAEYGAETLALLRQGAFLTATQYLRAQRVRALIASESGTLMERVTALALPTIPIVAPAIGQSTVTLGDRPTDARGVITRFVRIINFVGLPAISVPCGFGTDGLPVGLQIVGRPNDEPTVLAIAHAYEQATPWHTRRPPEPTGGM
jgi:aspartyl-tRNA(Asn)/glutamyl-tRNA(Gln) amidotransferase subunit A